MIPSPENCFCYNKLKENRAFFYREYGQKEQQIMVFIILCLFFTGSYFACQFSQRMPLYLFEQAINFPCTFAVEQHSTNLSISFAKLNPKHIFFSLAINFKRINYSAEYLSTNITVNSQFKFYDNFNFDFAENSTLSDLPIEFFNNETASPLCLFYIKQGINFTGFDVNLEVASINFSGIQSVRFTCFTMNANTWNFTSLFRLGVFFATSYFLIGVLFCYSDNNDFPLHKEFLLVLILGFFGINIFQRFAAHQFLWFRYTYLASTIFYACYRLFMLKFLYLLKGDDVQFICQDTFKWIGYISIILIEIFEIFDVEMHSSNSYWLYNPNGQKSILDYITIVQNYYYCLLVAYLIFNIYVYAKISTDQTKTLATILFGILFFASIIFNFYVECIFGLFNHLRKSTARFFVEHLNAYLVLFALSFVHNTRCITFPKFD